ncbi:MAG: hypothetical protein M1481_05365 [Candidatus Thermoplasmatota archaeon]|jgi:uncharacterized OB-fold protein|nr:hypothetical protein [Candidatus Thermoplasmatota archaeon]MCL5963641.1 hypothetical protein [Candidatus Thermoplasmatota archaeon]
MGSVLGCGISSKKLTTLGSRGVLHEKVMIDRGVLMTVCPNCKSDVRISVGKSGYCTTCKTVVQLESEAAIDDRSNLSKNNADMNTEKARMNLIPALLDIDRNLDLPATTAKKITFTNSTDSKLKPPAVESYKTENRINTDAYMNHPYSNHIRTIPRGPHESAGFDTGNCNGCGSRLISGGRFCPRCGTPQW